MKNVISLGPEVLDDEGNLVVEIFDNSPSQFAGDSYGRIPIDVTGGKPTRAPRGRRGSIRLAAGYIIYLAFLGGRWFARKPPTGAPPFKPPPAV